MALENNNRDGPAHEAQAHTVAHQDILPQVAKTKAGDLQGANLFKQIAEAIGEVLKSLNETKPIVLVFIVVLVVCALLLALLIDHWVVITSLGGAVMFGAAKYFGHLK
ncbi:MAG: hypothetical protein WDM89_19510 [Rhizomicrobium sp.]